MYISIYLKKRIECGKKAQNEKLYAQYEILEKARRFGAERKAQKALAVANDYHETYRIEIVMYEEAEQYLKKTLQKHFDPKKLQPISKCKAEQAELNAEKSKLNQQYAALKN